MHSDSPVSSGHRCTGTAASRPPQVVAALVGNGVGGEVALGSTAARMPKIAVQSQLAAPQSHAAVQDSDTKLSGAPRKRKRRAARPLKKDLWPDRHFWGLVLQPQRDDAAQQEGKKQLVTREYHLHITQATLLVDENGTPREAATARTQLWIANSNHGEVGAAEDHVPRLVCSLSAGGRESQRLSVRLSGQRVRLMAVGQGCTLHLSGCLEQLPEEEEDDDSDSDSMWSDASSSGSDSEIESGSGDSSSSSDTVAVKGRSKRAGSQLSAMLSTLDDSDSDDEDYTYKTPSVRPDSPE